MAFKSAEVGPERSALGILGLQRDGCSVAYRDEARTAPLSALQLNDRSASGGPFLKRCPGENRPYTPIGSWSEVRREPPALLWVISAPAVPVPRPPPAHRQTSGFGVKASIVAIKEFVIRNRYGPETDWAVYKLP